MKLLGSGIHLWIMLIILIGSIALSIFVTLKYKNQPKSYAIIYLLLIPLFAFWFFFVIPDNFYHSTVNYEDLTKKEYKEIIDDLDTYLKSYIFGKEIIDATYDNNGLNRKFFVCGVPLYPSNFHVESMSSINEREVLSLVVGTESNKENMISNYKVDLVFDPDMMLASYRDGAEDINIHLISHVDRIKKLPMISDSKYEEKLEEMFQCLFKPFDSKHEKFKGYIFLPLSWSKYSRIKHYFESIKGNPAKLPGHFIRMLYLSSVTITTLGYGDIVPTTSISRISISAEAIYGIVVIGLFLNAISKRDK